MTYLLQRALKKYLEEVFKGSYGQSPPSGEMIEPRFWIGAMPPKRNDRNRPAEQQKQGEDFPFVVIRGISGAFKTGDRSPAKIMIICGAWIEPDDDPEQGVIEIEKMLAKVNRGLLNLDDGLLEKKYELQDGSEWKAGLDEDGNQPHPHYYMTMTTRWLLPPGERTLTATEEVLIYGSGYNQE